MARVQLTDGFVEAVMGTVANWRGLGPETLAAALAVIGADTSATITADNVVVSPTVEGAIDVQSALTVLDANKSPVGHTHAAGAITFAPVGAISSIDVQAALAELDVEKSPVGHGHIIADVAGLQGVLDGKAPVGAVYAGSSITNVPAGGIASTTVQAAINELDAEKSPVGHTHPASAIGVTPSGGISSTNVGAALNELDGKKSPVGHGHIIADVTGLQGSLDSKVPVGTVYSAGMITVTPTGGITQTDVQAALAAISALSTGAMPATGAALAPLLLSSAAEAALDHRVPLSALDQRFGMVRDAVDGLGGSASSTVNPNNFVDPGARFTASMTGKTLVAYGIGAAGGKLVTTVTYVNPTTLLMADPALTTLASGGKWTVGTLNNAALQLLINAAYSDVGLRHKLVIPAGRYLYTVAPTFPTTIAGFYLEGEQPEFSREGSGILPTAEYGTALLWRGAGPSLDLSNTATRWMFSWRNILTDCGPDGSGHTIGSTGFVTTGVDYSGSTFSGPNKTPWLAFNNTTKVLTRSGMFGLKLMSVYEGHFDKSLFIGFDYGVIGIGCDHLGLRSENFKYNNVHCKLQNGGASQVHNSISGLQMEGGHLAGVVCDSMQLALTDCRIEMTGHPGFYNGIGDLTADLGVTAQVAEGGGMVVFPQSMNGIIHPGECVLRLTNPTTGEYQEIVPDAVNGRIVTFRNQAASGQITGSDGVANGTTAFTGSGLSAAINGKFITLMDGAGNSHTTTVTYVSPTALTLGVAAPFSANPCYYAIGADGLNGHDYFKFPFTHAAATVLLLTALPVIARVRASTLMMANCTLSVAGADRRLPAVTIEKGLGGAYLTNVDASTPLCVIGNYPANEAQQTNGQGVFVENCPPSFFSDDGNPMIISRGPKARAVHSGVFRPAINAQDLEDGIKRRFVFTPGNYAYRASSVSFYATYWTRCLDDYAITKKPLYVFRNPINTLPRFCLPEIPTLFRWAGVRITVRWRPTTTAASAIFYGYFNEVDGADTMTSLQSGITSTAWREEVWTETTIPAKWSSVNRVDGTAAGLQLQFSGAQAEIAWIELAEVTFGEAILASQFGMRGDGSTQSIAMLRKADVYAGSVGKPLRFTDPNYVFPSSFSGNTFPYVVPQSSWQGTYRGGQSITFLGPDRGVRMYESGGDAVSMTNRFCRAQTLSAPDPRSDPPYAINDVKAGEGAVQFVNNAEYTTFKAAHAVGSFAHVAGGVNVQDADDNLWMYDQLHKIDYYDDTNHRVYLDDTIDLPLSANGWSPGSAKNVAVAWAAGQSITAGDYRMTALLQHNSSLYVALTSGTTAGASLLTDTGVVWAQITAALWNNTAGKIGTLDGRPVIQGSGVVPKDLVWSDLTINMATASQFALDVRSAYNITFRNIKSNTILYITEASRYIILDNCQVVNPYAASGTPATCLSIYQARKVVLRGGLYAGGNLGVSGFECLVKMESYCELIDQGALLHWRTRGFASANNGILIDRGEYIKEGGEIRGTVDPVRMGVAMAKGYDEPRAYSAKIDAATLGIGVGDFRALDGADAIPGWLGAGNRYILNDAGMVALPYAHSDSVQFDAYRLVAIPFTYTPATNQATQVVACPTTLTDIIPNPANAHLIVLGWVHSGTGLGGGCDTDVRLQAIHTSGGAEVRGVFSTTGANNRNILTPTVPTGQKFNSDGLGRRYVEAVLEKLQIAVFTNQYQGATPAAYANGQTVTVGSVRRNSTHLYKVTAQGGGTTANAPVQTDGSTQALADGYSWQDLGLMGGGTLTSVVLALYATAIN